MAKLILLFCFICGPGFALKLQYLGSSTLPHQMKFKKSRIGGLSGAWFDSSNQALWAVSDDRGKIGEPRIYKFAVNWTGKELKIEPKDVVYIQLKKLKDQVLDMEGLTILPWGNFLISSEGDNNHKPKAWPLLMDVKKDGSFVRSYDIPEEFLPEKTGQQKKGIRNNTGLEGLTAWPDKNLIWAWMEGPLFQDADGGAIRVLQYEMPEAWVIKPTLNFRYQTEAGKKIGDQILLPAQVSEALALSDHEFLVLERSVTVSPKGAGFAIQIFKADLKDLDAQKIMKKTLVLDLETLKDQLGDIDNFEALSFGPVVDGAKTLLMLSDDNFRSVQKNQFVIFKILEESATK